MPEGRYDQLVAAKGRILVTQFPVKGIRPNYVIFEEVPEAGSLYAYAFEEARFAPVQREVGRIRMAQDGQTLVYRSKDRVRLIDALMPLPGEGGEPPPAGAAMGRKTGWIDLSRAHTLVQPQQEWLQMYEEAWRLQHEQFWDADMSDIDWDIVHDRYASLREKSAHAQ